MWSLINILSIQNKTASKASESLPNINHLEAVQRPAARMCYKNYSNFLVSSMLSNLDLPTLQSRKNRSKLQMLYKIIHKLVDFSRDC